MYRGQTNFKHGAEQKLGILLVNLGTPEAPTARALRPYLRDFLSDPRVIELPRLRWWLIRNLFILPFRPKQSAALYQKVWTEKGSPLLLIGIEQRDALRAALEKEFPGIFAVELGMRIGEPNIKGAFESLDAANAHKIFVLPLFPQYSGTTTASVFDGVADILKTWRWVPELRMLGSYHDHELYIEALAASVEDSWSKKGRAQKLLMSFHGIPKRYFENGNPYFCHCQKTARLLVERLKLNQSDYVVSFQSLFGREEWLRPYTSEKLAELAMSGVKSLDVICPGFSADCLETIEEIEEQNKEIFLHKGGEVFNYIPALNAREDHIKLLTQLVRENTSTWLDKRAIDTEASAKRASALGARS